MTKHESEDDAGMARVEVLLSQAAADAPRPPDDLFARVLADARAQQAGHVPQRRSGRARPGGWAALVRGLGGWPSLGGLAVAVCAGFWIGVSAPTLVPGVDAALFGSPADTIDESLLDPSGLGWQIEEVLSDAG